MGKHKHFWLGILLASGWGFLSPLLAAPAAAASHLHHAHHHEVPKHSLHTKKHDLKTAYSASHRVHHHLHHVTESTGHTSQRESHLQHQSLALLGENKVCSTAESELGKPYVWGGDTPGEGFDCSGFSQYVYKRDGLTIPRTAASQFASLTPVHHLQDGDLVFFKTFGHRVSHVGIYLGNGYFIHSPRPGEKIRIDNIDSPYWRERYAGARRVLTNQA